MANAVAETILSQLGNGHFLAMTGAKNLVNGGDYLQFDLPRGSLNKASKCRISLADDLYTVTFYRWDRKAFDMVVVGETAGVYADNLRAVFTKETGLYTAL